MAETRRGYHPDNASFGRFMMSPLVFRWALEGAYAVQAIAARTTNRGRGPGPHLADSYIVTPIPDGVVLGRERNRRGAAQVENHLGHAAAHEFGNSQGRGYRVLGTAGAAVGEFRGKLDDE